MTVASRGDSVAFRSEAFAPHGATQLPKLRGLIVQAIQRGREPLVRERRNQ